MNEFRPQTEVTNADRTINEFSTYQGALGQAGVTADQQGPRSTAYLANPGDFLALTPGPQGFPEMYVGCGWNIQRAKAPGFLGSLLGLVTARKVDIDLGCLYQLESGETGALQALGRDHGSYKTAPYIMLSHDDRTGARAGDDEFLRINGAHWSTFKRVLIYAYVYTGASTWADVAPDVTLKITGHPDLHVRPNMGGPDLAVCAIALIEQIRGGLKLTNLTQYFPGQAEMDRAFGFGIRWRDGTKGPL
jgi:tellurite resistance protein TerA